MDPHSSAWDLTDDPMAYYKKRFEMSQELLELIPEYFEKPTEFIPERYMKHLTKIFIKDNIFLQQV